MPMIGRLHVPCEYYYLMGLDLEGNLSLEKIESFKDSGVKLLNC
jgi:hypothetical protein